MTPEQTSALRAPFPSERVGKLPKAGLDLDYVGHGAVTERLLEVDPEWSWEPFALDERGLPALDEFGNLWIKLTVGGVTRPGVGDGPNMKILIGDALRNAAMRFGVALDLWIRGQAEDDERVPQHRQQSRRAPQAPVSAFLDTFNELHPDVKNKVLPWLRERGHKPTSVPDELMPELTEFIASLGAPEGAKDEGGTGDLPSAPPSVSDRPALGAVKGRAS